jgi:hypothetical protein
MSGPPDPGQALRWPAGYSPGCSDVWARSDVVVEATPAVVFWHLAAVSRWESTFSGIRVARVPDAGSGCLEPDSVFEFDIEGLRLCARVIEFAAGRRLAWSGQGIDITAYHAWVISAGRRRSTVLAGFAARGAAAIALREPDPGAAQRTLDRWAADLKTAAESAPR